MIKNIFRIKIFDDMGKPMHEIKERKPKKLKEQMDDYFKKLM